MRILAFRHVPFEHLGLIADSLEAQGVEWEYADLYQAPEQLPAAMRADGLIFMGGPMSANDDLPYIRQELRFIAQAICYRKPVLGVCLGAQLVARALGGRVYGNAVKEIGWAPVTWTEAAQNDRLFGGLNGPETVFHWHGETFDLPPGAELLASSPDCRNQAFRVGANVYGLQFHLEVTPPMIADWCAQEANAADLRDIAGPIDPEANAARLREVACTVFGRWCELLK